MQPHYRREHWPLINGVCPLADGTVAASLRSVSAVIIIDRATGEITWRPGPDTVAQQHCPSELPDGSLLLFDNGTFRTGESVPYSRVIEVDRSTGAITWEYRDSPPEYFSAHQDKEAAGLFPDATNAIFRAYRYIPEEVPWLP